MTRPRIQLSQRPKRWPLWLAGAALAAALVGLTVVVLGELDTSADAKRQVGATPAPAAGTAATSTSAFPWARASASAPMVTSSATSAQSLSATVEVCGYGTHSRAAVRDGSARVQERVDADLTALQNRLKSAWSQGSDWERALAAGLSSLDASEPTAPQALRDAHAQTLNALAAQVANSNDYGAHALTLQLCRSASSTTQPLANCESLAAVANPQRFANQPRAWLDETGRALARGDDASATQAIARAAAATDPIADPTQRAQQHALRRVTGDFTPVAELTVLQGIAGMPLLADSRWSTACADASRLQRDPARREACSTLAERWMRDAPTVADLGLIRSAAVALQWPAQRLAALDAERDARFGLQIALERATQGNGRLNCDRVQAQLSLLRRSASESERATAARYAREQGMSTHDLAELARERRAALERQFAQPAGRAALPEGQPKAVAPR